MSTQFRRVEYLPEVQGLEFDGERHAYTYRGIKFPSVTQLMEPMSAMLYANVPEDVLSFAAERGTKVHEQISNYVQYGVIETDEETQGYFDAFLQFEKDHQPTWLASEYRTINLAMNYCGTVDLIGFITPEDEIGVDVVDIKTTAKYHGNMLSAQVGAYAMAIVSQGVPVRDRYGLQLMRDGKYRFEKLNDGYKLFQHSMAIWSAMQSDLVR